MRPRIVLSYPDVYEIGVSNPALQILYSQINDATTASAERAYCPWPDMADLMRAAGVPLWTLESFAQVGECDLWGFTLPHELSYANVLEMLDLAGVPLLAGERDGEHPIVLGGGPAVANPWPLAPFFDAFFIGEAEDRLGALVAALEQDGREARLRTLAAVPGVWMPGRSTGPAERQVFMGFSASQPVLRPVVPVLEAVHDRAVVEVMRGCTAGCRFCQAGMWYRPVRERPVDLVVAAADRLLGETGCDEVSLLSLSSCDYSGVTEALTRIRELRPGLRVSLPSLRIDSAAESLARFAADQRGSVTLAPEAGTQELRDTINKGVDEAQFDEAVRATFEGGFTGLKLYFMIGLPGETDEDVLGIARMAGAATRLAREIGKGRARVSVAVSSYVPKAHTPFELERFAGEQVLRRRQQLVREATPRGVRVAFHDVAASVVEATLARGGPGTARLVEAAWRRGARFDGWSEHFDVRRWEEAAAATGIGLGEPGVGRPSWREAVDARLSEGFFADEVERSRAGEPTEDCRDGACGACGVCAGEIGMDLIA
ncbi:MAG TPA: radical SAM protein [Thermoleophilia bacterium]|nr:radical SAM protein [Thermoleophilia bacterium]